MQLVDTKKHPVEIEWLGTFATPAIYVQLHYQHQHEIAMDIRAESTPVNYSLKINEPVKIIKPRKVFLSYREETSRFNVIINIVVLIRQ